MTSEQTTIVEAVAAFHAATKAFNERPTSEDDGDEEQERDVASTFGPPLAVLEEWSKPAASPEEALAAVNFAIEEASHYHCVETVVAMLQAIRGYLERATA